MKVKGATKNLDSPTLCDEWDVRTLLNHMLDTQRYFIGTAYAGSRRHPIPRAARCPWW